MLQDEIDKQLGLEDQQQESAEDGVVGDQPVDEPKQELSPYEAVLNELPEEKRKIIEEGFLRQSDYTKKTTDLARQREEFDTVKNELKRKAETYDKLISNDEYRRQVYETLKEKYGVDEKPKHDPFEDEWQKAQSVLDELDPNSRKAIDVLVKKAVRDGVKPYEALASEIKKERARIQEQEVLTHQQRINRVYEDFVKAHPDFTEIENDMVARIKRNSNFFNQSAENVSAELEDMYEVLMFKKNKNNIAANTAKKVLKQNDNAQKQAARASTVTGSKNASSKKNIESIDDAFEAALRQHGVDM